MTDPPTNQVGHDPSRHVAGAGEAGEAATNRPQPTAWGTRWLERVAMGADLDAGALARSRGTAAQRTVIGVEIDPGSVRVLVAGRSGDPQRVQLGVRRFSQDDWQRAAEVIASSRRFLVAVLDGDLPPQLMSALQDEDCDLLPGRSEVSLDCDCGSASGLCAHAKAAAGAVAVLIDADPHLLVSLRGGDRSVLVAPARPTEAPPAGVPHVDPAAVSGRVDPEPMSAATAWRRSLQPLPDLDLRRSVVRRPNLSAQAPPAEFGFDQAGLDRLTKDAALRAAKVLGEDAPTGLRLDLVTDAVRRAAIGTMDRSLVADVAGCSQDEAELLIAAMVSVGPAGVEVLAGPRRLGSAELAEIGSVWDGPVRERSTGVTLEDGRQLRRSSDGTWVLLEFVDPVGWRAVAAATALEDLSPG